MHVRIAQFEVGDDNWDERIADIRRRIQDGAHDNPELAGAISRSLMLVDRENRRGAGVFFCETEEDLRKVDEFMNNATPPGTGDRRTAVAMYEVAVDSQDLV